MDLLIAFKIKKNRFVFFMGLLIIHGCHKKIPFDAAEFEQIPTLNSILATDSLFTLHASLTGKMGRDSLPVLEDALVDLYIDGTFAQTLQYTQKGIYQANHRVKPSHQYKCVLNYPNSPAVAASCTVPKATPFNKIQLIYHGWIDETGETQPTIVFTIPNDTTTTQYFDVWARIFYRSKGSNENFRFRNYHQVFLFNTEHQKSTVVSKHLEFSRNSYSPNYEYAYIFELRSVTYGYYRYAESLKLYNQGRFPEFNTSSPEPFNLYSNVKNGYGIFAAYSYFCSDTLTQNNK